MKKKEKELFLQQQKKRCAPNIFQIKNDYLKER